MQSNNPIIIYLAYAAALGAIAGPIAMPYQTSIAANPPVFLIPLIAFLIIPIPLFLAYRSQGTLAKILRLLTFRLTTYLRVDVFAAAALLTLLLNSYLYFYNLIIRHMVFGPDINNNVLVLNLCLILILTWILTGKFKMSQPHALLIRCPEGDKIYLYEDGKLRHIPNPLTLLLLGHSLQHVITVNHNEFSSYTIGTPLPDITAAPYAIDKAGSYWVILEGIRHEIPDIYTLSLVLGGRTLAHQPAPPLDTANTKKGAPIRSAFDIGLTTG